VTNTDEATRVTQYQDAERILVEEASIIPMFRGKAVRAVKTNVRDLYFSPTLSVVYLHTVKIAAE